MAQVLAAKQHICDIPIILQGDFSASAKKDAHRNQQRMYYRWQSFVVTYYKD